ncbi:MAG TPA: wax ester/triacylglycerol synthase family O-acyltransferase [Rhodoferax sp.]|jgi:WS/DGAT/MGAT family acyltransferase|nr:wax ester/triacylglycerol synthase family O-acyltransferase [Rhodoferax sp.]HNV58396.1 wax ester/triacylglycerol synthase family O-acyltransferase [Rhodoferax sp.]
MNPISLNPLDAAWIVTESRATPNHVGGLLQFKLPEDAPKDFMRKTMAAYRNHRQFKAPWNQRLKPSFSMNPVRVWVEDTNIDLEYHVRHAALPWPGGERELGELVGRLQSTPLDLSRPPWECTLIEGLEGNRFAMFIKMHHSLIDGISGVKLLQSGMSFDRETSLHMPPFWATGKESHTPKARKHQEALLPTVTHAIAGAVQELRMQASTVPQLVSAFGKLVKHAMNPADSMALPFVAPRSVLNGRVREKRRFATQQFSLERMRNLAGAAECTLNDIVLAVCGGALRRFLDESNNLPEQPLTAGIPVSVRPKDDTGNGNAITFIVSTLGTDVVDVRERLAAIRQSVKQAKEHVQSLPRQAMMQYTVLLMAPTILTLLTGIGGRIRPMFNITISNVPGPDKPLYLRGAEMVATYPASIVTHGQALNITCQSYAGFMNFGYTGCHSSMPSMQRLAVYTAEALAEMEAAFLPHAVVATKPSPRKAAAKPPAKTSAKTVRAVKPKVPAPTEVVAPAAKPRAARKTA